MKRSERNGDTRKKKMITFCWVIRGGNTGEISQRMRTELTYKGMTPPSTQNLKAVGLWVFFLICCSTFSFLLNVGLRLTLGYLTNLPLK